MYTNVYIYIYRWLYDGVYFSVIATTQGHNIRVHPVMNCCQIEWCMFLIRIGFGCSVCLRLWPSGLNCEPNWLHEFWPQRASHQERLGSIMVFKGRCLDVSYNLSHLCILVCSMYSMHVRKYVCTYVRVEVCAYVRMYLVPSK